MAANQNWLQNSDDSAEPRYMRVLVLSALLLSSPLAHAGQVLRIMEDRGLIGVSNDGAYPWREGDWVCHVNDGREVPIARVRKANAKVGLADLGKTDPSYVRAGMDVQRCLHKVSERELSNVPTLGDSVRRGGPAAKTNISLGLAAGLDYFFPYLHFQYSVKPQLTLGIEPFFVSTNPDTNQKVSALGAFATATYYFRPPVFNGFFIEGALGMYKIDGDNGVAQESASPFSVFFLAGWRGLHYKAVSAGAALGFQYILREKLPAGSIIEFGGLVPQFAMEVGVDF